MTIISIARLKVTLDHVKPLVMRRIDVPLTIRLDRLHLVLQAALGWTNSHLYELSAGDCGWGTPETDYQDFDLPGPRDARKARLRDVIEDIGTMTLRYLYDFGDSWQHTIKIERITAAVPGIDYPCLIDATGRCPPEDCGGIGGYQDFLAAIVGPGHEQHAECITWAGEPFDPNVVDIGTISSHIQALAKKWARRSSVARRPS